MERVITPGRMLADTFNEDPVTAYAHARQLKGLAPRPEEGLYQENHGERIYSIHHRRGVFRLPQIMIEESTEVVMEIMGECVITHAVAADDVITYTAWSPHFECIEVHEPACRHVYIVEMNEYGDFEFRPLNRITECDGLSAMRDGLRPFLFAHDPL